MKNNSFGTCCATCQLYWKCETKWYRGERGEKDICCKLCASHDDCLIEKVKREIRLKKGLEIGQAQTL